MSSSATVMRWIFPRGPLRWETGHATRTKLVTAASFRTWPGWRAARPRPTSRWDY